MTISDIFHILLLFKVVLVQLIADKKQEDNGYIHPGLGAVSWTHLGNIRKNSIARCNHSSMDRNELETLTAIFLWNETKDKGIPVWLLCESSV